MTAKSGAELGKENAARLEDYLASVESLPTRGGKINVTAIARACGFDRQVLYTNPACKALLDAAAENSPLEARSAGSSIKSADQMVPTSKLREAERRIQALEKKISEMRARIVGLETRLRRQSDIEDHLISRGRRAFPDIGTKLSNSES
ncbi:DUF6262 family protein [Donghicola eburneus]|uniref:None n=1 Tax=Donghicola eburneus TaxID=393278 RepID=A0A1M4N5G1_9RHOB|nr:DUF6262 family protein [Donghicola eburneus]SCM68316.1 none [Donghicola eburneus]